MPGLRSHLRELADRGQHERDRWMHALASSAPPGALVLDVGAGPGRYRRLFSHCEYFAHDLARYTGTDSGINQDSWRYGQLDFVSDIATLPLRHRAFDIVICTEVLEHVLRPEAAVAEMARILRPGGKLWLSAPLRSGLHQEPFHFYGGFTPHFYRWVAGESGLRLDRVEPVGGLFAALAEDTSRAGRVLVGGALSGPLRPLRPVIRLCFQILLPLLYNRLDRSHPHEELTIEYLVEATRSR